MTRDITKERASGTIGLLTFYWLVTAAGLLAGLTVLTDTIGSRDFHAWIAATLGMGLAGSVMLFSGALDILQQRRFRPVWHISLGVILGTNFSLLLSVLAINWVAGIFTQLTLVCWTLQVFVLIYFGNVILRFRKQAI